MRFELKERFIFGVDSSNVGCPVSFFDDANIAYLAGDSVIIQNIVTKKQRFVSPREQFEIIGITASNSVLVVVEEPKERPFTPHFSIYVGSIENGYVKTFEVDIEKEFASTSTLHRQKVVPLCIHKETALIAAVLRTSQDNSFTLFCWDRRGTFLTKVNLDKETTKETNLHMSFHWQDNLICIQGDHSFWLYRIIENRSVWSLRLINFPTQKQDIIDIEESLVFTCHCWTIDSESSIIFGTDKGNIVLTDAGKVVGSIQVGYPVESVLGLSSGFIVGGPNAACCVYGKNGSNPEYKCRSAFSIKNSSIEKSTKLNAMTISPSHEKMCAFLSGVNEIYAIDLNKNVDINEECFMQVACRHTNVHAIVSCAQKPVILTAGSDRTVRCWDYETGQLRLSKQFTEIPTSISFHPSGLHAIISFQDEVRCVHVLLDDLRTFWKIRLPRKMCSNCVFSKGGHKFAVAHDNLIRIFDFYTGKISQELRGHNYRISKMNWRHGDSEIISVDEDGIIYRWDIHRSQIMAECTRYKANLDYQCSFVSDEALLIFSETIVEVLSPVTLELRECIVVEKVETSRKKLLRTIVSNEDSSIILFGLQPTSKKNSSLIRIGSFPPKTLVDIPFDKQFEFIEVNENVVFVKGATDSLHIMELVEQSARNTLITQNTRGFIDTNSWCNHCLMSEMHLEEKDASIQNLMSLSLELKSNHEYKLSIKKMKYKEENCDLEEKYEELRCNEEVESKRNKEYKGRLRSRFGVLSNTQTRNHNDQLLQIESDHNAKLYKIFERHNDEKKCWDHQIEDIARSKQSIIQHNEKLISNSKKDLVNMLNDNMRMTKNLQQELISLRLEFVERREQVEEDIDEHLHTHKINDEQMILTERQATLKVTSENGILCKRTNALMQNIEDQKEAIKHLLYREELNNEEISMLENSILNLDATKKERDKILISKEKTNSRFKTKQEELTKFSLLDEKIKELNVCVSNDTVIPTTEKKLNEKEALLNMYFSEHADIEKLLSYRQLEIHSKREKLSKQNKKYMGLESKIESMKKDMHHCASLINQPAKLIKFLLERNKDRCDLRIQPDEITTTEDNTVEKLNLSLNRLTNYLQIQTEREIQELKNLRSYNHSLLDLIRKKVEKNHQSHNHVESIRKE